MPVITPMSQSDRLLLRILRGTSDANIPFEGLCQLLRRLGFDERIRGSHHIFTKEGVEEILNLPPQGRQAKPYQVKQVRAMSDDYRYEIIMYWSEEDQAFIAEVPELPGCAAASTVSNSRAVPAAAASGPPQPAPHSCDCGRSS
jgi:predicted RNA binding protein YcfA (HicA-like mRNA interferase family)